MKRDIREIFRKNELPKKKLPDFHKDEFLGKLEKFNKKEKPKSFFKIVVSIALILSVGYYFLNSETEIKQENQPTLLVQVKQIEKEYLNNINKEWNNFVKLTDDKNLIKKYKEKLSALDIGYKEISKQFKIESNNISVLEKLIKNLQTRLQFLKDIQNHIKILNQKNISYETITI
jgi:hypothetical protein